MSYNGERPLKRAVREQLRNSPSMKLIEGDFKPGDRIKVTASDDELVFAKK
jgi:ATP-dependent Clp protease ATP-binding subunit ClpA